MPNRYIGRYIRIGNLCRFEYPQTFSMNICNVGVNERSVVKRYRILPIINEKIASRINIIPFPCSFLSVFLSNIVSIVKIARDIRNSANSGGLIKKSISKVF